MAPEARVQPEATTTEIFMHIRVPVGMVLSLGIARLLTGVARFVQHAQLKYYTYG